MIRNINAAMTLATLAVTLGLQPSVKAQQSKAKTVETGTFHGKVHSTSGRATIYQEPDGKLVLRLTNFKTSNGPDVHVILIAARNADDDANFLKSNIDRVELGSLKGNEGDQNYEIAAGTPPRRMRNSRSWFRARTPCVCLPQAAVRPSSHRLGLSHVPRRGPRGSRRVPAWCSMKRSWA